MNLLTDAWLPLRRASGVVEWVAPHHLTSHIKTNPFVAIASNRADFNGALTEFLIGLLQTAMAPDEETWFEMLEDGPPSPEDLEAKLAPHEAAFAFTGPGARFMQDLTLEEVEDKRIGQLLIDEPGDSALKKNTDHFVKRERLEGLCLPCSAAALYTLQTYAPSGGAGHRTSLRGGGPLTSIITGRNLWETCWLNVMPVEAFIGNYEAHEAVEATFPWMAETRTSEKKTGRDTLPTDCHPNQMYWGMPRRIRLVMDEALTLTCGICHREMTGGVRAYNTQNYGINYQGTWRHPLSPHRIDKKGLPIPLHPGSTGLPYRYWMGVVVEKKVMMKKGEQLEMEPARAVQRFTREMSNLDVSIPKRIAVFGYDMDNMNPRCWYEGEMPLIFPEADNETLLEAFSHGSAQFVKAASEAAGELGKAAFKVQGNPDEARHSFWSETEEAFYEALRDLRSELAQGDALEVRRTWREVIAKAALEIFERVAMSGHFGGQDPAKVAKAHHALRLALYGKTIRELLSLPKASRRKSA